MAYVQLMITHLCMFTMKTGLGRYVELGLDEQWKNVDLLNLVGSCWAKVIILACYHQLPCIKEDDSFEKLCLWLTRVNMTRQIWMAYVQSPSKNSYIHIFYHHNSVSDDLNISCQCLWWVRESFYFYDHMCFYYQDQTRWWSWLLPRVF